MQLATRMIDGMTVSDAWLRAITEVNAAHGQRLYHLVTQIPRPSEERSEIRAAANWLSGQLNYPAIDTVANTIFPYNLAVTCTNYEELSDRYLSMYEMIKNLDKGNKRGTYFGRLVDYPSPSGSCNQLVDLVRKLKTETALRGPKSGSTDITVGTCS